MNGLFLPTGAHAQPFMLSFTRQGNRGGARQWHRPCIFKTARQSTLQQSDVGSDCNRMHGSTAWQIGIKCGGHHTYGETKRRRHANFRPFQHHESL